MGSDAPLQVLLAHPGFRELGLKVPELCLAHGDVGVNPEKPGVDALSLLRSPCGSWPAISAVSGVLP